MKKPALAALVAALSASPAIAKEWQLDKSASEVLFIFTQLGSPVEGQFEQFDTSIDFDPEAPEDASVRAVIQTASLDTKNRQRDEGARGPDWFAVNEHPEAVFESSSFSHQGGDSYTVEGDLSLRGVTQPVTLPMTISVNGETASAEGEVTVDRRDFELGTNGSEADEAIGDDVTIRLDLEARASG